MVEAREGCFISYSDACTGNRIWLSDAKKVKFLEKNIFTDFSSKEILLFNKHITLFLWNRKYVQLNKTKKKSKRQKKIKRE